MQKWEYLKTWTYNPSQYLNKFRMIILPRSKIEVAQLAKTFPGLKIEEDKDSAHALFVFPPKDDQGFYYDVVEYLCGEGWEPFTVENNVIHYRRAV